MKELPRVLFICKAGQTSEKLSTAFAIGKGNGKFACRPSSVLDRELLQHLRWADYAITITPDAEKLVPELAETHDLSVKTIPLRSIDRGYHLLLRHGIDGEILHERIVAALEKRLKAAAATKLLFRARRA